MKFNCRPVGLEFLNKAPIKFINEVELNASPAQVFSILENAEAWPHWFKEIVQVEWHHPKPYGVGTTRTVKLTTITVEEFFFVWEQDKRFAFYLTSMSLPLAKALVEEYRLIPLGENRSQLTYTVCLEPSFWLRLGSPWLLNSYEQMFQQAVKDLAVYIHNPAV
ncbi:SRPBCC family protein [Acaryochloris sp. IP29b_bin.137]|uniref:SRPBCC family protein n=1 Tax=Acaryochloris sp. IP29b_bin.137 TaxID=2969217 RepID=UPI00263695D7|nr:SRPBCC family protein [Acaryochloris sp. IP29b_bin.137]